MLSATQERLISIILQSRTYSEAAKEVGISMATLFRWLKEPAFKQAYNEAQDQLREDISAQVRGCADLAVSTLKQVMLDLNNTKVKERISAAKTILDILYKDYDRKYIDRIKALEGPIGSDQKNVLEDLPDSAVKEILSIINKHKKAQE